MNSLTSSLQEPINRKLAASFTSHDNVIATAQANSLPPLPYKSFAHPYDIRLLVLEPGQGDDPIQCRMTHVFLGHDPEFEALSYVWGTASETRFITCSINEAELEIEELDIEVLDTEELDMKDPGTDLEPQPPPADLTNRTYYRLPITTNLFRALLRIRRPDACRTLWIDQLCINQNDTKEKTHQISEVMGLIFSQARRVLIWLGESEQDSDIAMSLIPKVVTCLKEIPPCEVFSTELLSGFGLPDWTDSAWNALAHFMHRPWFTRVWVVQEVALSQAASIFCGGMQLPWETLEAFISQGQNLGGFATDISNRFVQPLSRRVSASTQVRLITEWKDEDCRSLKETRHHPSTYLIKALRGVRPLDASLPLDKVYSLYGIVPGNTWAYFPATDYESPVCDSFYEIALVILKQEGASRMLSEAGRSRQTLDLNLPSWVPDWSFRSVGTTFWRANFLSISYQRRKSIEPITPLYQAGLPSVHGCKSSYRPNQRQLILSAKTVAELDQVGTELPDSADVARDDNFNTRTFRRVMGYQLAIQQSLELVARCRSGLTKESTMVARRTLVAGRTSTNLRTSDHEVESMFHQFHNFVTLSGAEAIPSISRWTPEEWKEMEANMDGAEALMGILSTSFPQMVFFTTYEGRFGLAPLGSEPGDLVCVVLGYASPFILRRSEDKYILIGECYVDGLMDGEAIKMEQYPFEDVTLI